VFANKVAWLTSQRFVYGQTIGHLQAAESLLPVEDRRRDLRVLDSVEAATMKARDRQSPQGVAIGVCNLRTAGAAPSEMPSHR
jgi:chorismate mutase